MIAELFVHPQLLSENDILWLVLPLCLAVAVVYKTIRAQTLHRLWLHIMLLMLYMTAGLTALGLVLWGVYTLAVQQ